MDDLKKMWWFVAALVVFQIVVYGAVFVGVLYAIKKIFF